MDDSLIVDRYYNLTLRFLSYRPRSEKEVYEYLKKKTKKLATTESTEKSTETLRETLIARIMQRLIELKFIDDREFAKSWIEQRTKFKQKPLWVIESELRQKGINKDLIDEVLSSFEQVKNVDIESAKKLAEKKLDFYRGLPPKKRYEKVTSYLLRKGFNYDIVKKVLLDSSRSLEE